MRVQKPRRFDQWNSRVGDLNAIAEDLDFGAWSSLFQILVNDRIGDQLADSHLWVHSDLGTKRLADVLVFRKPFVNECHETFESDSITLTPGLFADGLDAA